MDRFQIDHRTFDHRTFDRRTGDQMFSANTPMVIESKSIPTVTRRRLRPRFGYLIAMTFIATGALLIPPQVVLAAIVLATVCSIATVALAFIVQMPVPYLRGGMRSEKHFPAGKTATS